MRAGGSIEALRERFVRIAAATEAMSGLSPARARAVMEDRARRLARPSGASPRAAAVLDVVTFALAGERYAIETRHVREIIRAGEVTPIPGTPEFLLGVINLRGELLTVFDLRRLLGLAASEATVHARIVVLGVERPEVGALVDAVYEVTAVGSEEVRDSPVSLGGVAAECLRGVTNDALVVLDGGRLLASRELFVGQREEPANGHGGRGELT